MPRAELDPALARLTVRVARLEAEDEAERERLRLEAIKPKPHVEFQTRPLDWIVEKLGVPRETLEWALSDGYEDHVWDGTREPLVVALEALARGERLVGVESGTTTGKTFLVACVVYWFVACWEGARVFTFAPKKDQLSLGAWKEIGRLWPRFHAMFPDAELLPGALQVRMIPSSLDWGAFGYGVQVKAGEVSATAAQGMHAPHMLLVYEEGPGVDAAVYAAGEHTCGAPHNLRFAVGNPDSQQDPLHIFCKQPGAVHIRISALDHPNVVTGREIVPGGVSQLSIDERRVRYGPDNPFFLSRVRGISPKQAADALIRWEWLERAAARFRDEATRAKLAQGPQAWGVDVAASDGGDKGAIAKWLGATLPRFPSFACPDPVALGWRVAVESAAEQVKPQHIGVDSVGVGAGTVGKMKEVGCIAQALNGGKPAEVEVDPEGEQPVVEEELFGNARAQWWWQMRMDLFLDRVAIEYDEELFTDLTTPKVWTHKGRIWLEEKEDIRDRLVGGRSPDKGDACVYGNWVRQRWPVAPEEPPAPSAFDPAQLRREADESRRVHFNDLDEQRIMDPVSEALL